MKKFFTVLFLLLFTVLFTFLLLLGELKFYVLTPSFIKDPMRETHVYRKLVSNADELSQLMLKKQEPGIQEGINQMPDTAKKLSQAMLKSVDAKWMEREAEKTIDAIYVYATTGRPDVKISFDLRDFKTRLRKNLYPLLVGEYNKLPEVPVEQFDQQMAQNPGQFPSTRPVGLTMDQMLAKTGLNPIDEIMKNIPDKYDTSYVDKNNPDAMNGLAGLKKVQPFIGMINIAFWILLAATVALLLLFAKLTGKTWMEFTMRLGIFLSAALAPFGLFLILWYVTVNILLVDGLAMLNQPSLLVNQIIAPAAAYAIGRMSTHLLIWSGIIGLGGLTMAICSLYLRAKRIS